MLMGTEIRETERKYEFGPGAALPSLRDLPSVSQESEVAEQTLEAEYYDTADLRLVRSGVTLRRRRGGSDPGWHLKLPLNGDARREIQLPLGRTGRRVPAELAGLVRAYARGGALQPVALITTKRRGRVLLDHAGNSLAEVVEDDVSARTMGESTTLTHWREAEIELTGGDEGLLEAADKRFRRAGLRRAGHPAKLARALADQLPAPDREQRLTSAASAGDVMLAYARSQAAALQALDPMIRRGEPGSVHDMRVATRRLRSILKSAGKNLDMPAASGLRSAREALREALDAGRYIALLNDLDQSLRGPLPAGKARQPAADVWPAAVKRISRRVRRRARRAGRAPAGHARETAMHETRKAAKDARYTAEAASLVGRKTDRRVVRCMTKIQSTLGDHHDAVVARDTARDIGVRAYLAGENAFSFGLLYERCQRDALVLAEQARADWARAFGPKYARWLD